MVDLWVENWARQMEKGSKDDATRKEKEQAKRAEYFLNVWAEMARSGLSDDTLEFMLNNHVIVDRAARCKSRVSLCSFVFL